jgi:hypothetical protein
MNNTRNITRNARLGRHRAVRTILGLGILALGYSTGASSAAASNEFPPNPAATITAYCSASYGAYIHIDFSNAGGQSAAVFTTTINGNLFPDLVVTANTTSFEESPLPDNVAVPITITAPGMTSIFTTVGPLNCYDGTSTIRVDCVNNVPVLTATATNTGALSTVAQLVINDDYPSSELRSIAPGATTTFTHSLPDGLAYTGWISFNHEGTEAKVAGTPMCVPPTTQSTVPETTVPPTTAPPTTAPPTVIVDAPTTVALTVPVGTVLPSTGKSSATIAWIASLTLALGLMIIRAARRPRSSR